VPTVVLLRLGRPPVPPRTSQSHCGLRNPRRCLTGGADLSPCRACIGYRLAYASDPLAATGASAPIPRQCVGVAPARLRAGGRRRGGVPSCGDGGQRAVRWLAPVALLGVH
jgi:hypothetical protein